MTTKVSQTELRSYPAEVRAHSHAFHQIVLPLRGALELETGGRGGFVDRYGGALIRSGDVHAFQGHREGHRDAKCLVMDLPEGSVWDSRFDGKTFPFFPMDPAMHHLLRFIDLRGGLDPHTEALLASSTFQMLGEPDQNALPTALRQALRFLESSLRHPITVGQIAAECGVSESVLYALFRDWIGAGPMAHMTDLRMRHAKAALRSGDQPIARIAQECGYADQTAFTRVFRRKTGKTPAAFRRAGPVSQVSE